MIKIKYKGYEISQANNNHVMICKDNVMLFHGKHNRKLDKEGLKDMLKFYFFIIEKAKSDNNE